MTVAIIVVEPAEFTLVSIGATVFFGIPTTIEVGLWGPLDVVADEQIQLAIVVYIYPGRAGAPAPVAYPRRIAHIHKTLAVIVMQQPVAADTGDIKVLIAVVVIVSHGHAHALHRDVQAHLLGHIREGAVFVVVVEGQSGPLAGERMTGPPVSIDE